MRNWLPPGMTLLVATHRSSLLQLVDRLLVFDAGRLVADGPRDKVLKELEKRQGRGSQRGRANG
jgi:ATP-binding cassette subfamily C protein LapB